MQVPAKARSVSVFFKHSAIALAMAGAVTGCSLLEDRSQRYVSAPEGRPVEVPEGADSSRLGQVMPIRSIRTDDNRSLYPAAIPPPPDMTSDILDKNYVVEELDGRLWLLVNEVPGRLWPVVSAWMNESGLGIAYDSPQLGILQSELANFSKRSRELLGMPDVAFSAESKVVLQVRLAPGIRRKTTELRVNIVELEVAPGELLVWDDSADAVRQQTQRELLATLGEFLKQREDSKSFSRAASGMVTKPLVRLLSEDEEPAEIVVDLDYGRTWAEVNRSLEEAGVAVLDLNRSEGWLQVDFRTEDERNPGWFSWFRDSKKVLHTHTVNLQRKDGAVHIKAPQQSAYTGDRSEAQLLTSLFEHLY
ncbi:hypothetical protein C7H09_17925 [Marinobacter fuscus]|uniref:Outer membrane protein assembly factor BamC n=1 Tax=Marinobacter fuscus TaxID=2109942 RepID=A0A2T1K4A5_9GAMM|nr:outer membrane protein assembly factor BamC [Marinobacter fuscus]PSF04900.1 hypothetical protein C7H09_17925 [Marinobacter fuscus]